MSSHSVRVAGDEYLGEHHIYRPHRAGLPPLGSYVRELWRRRHFALEMTQSQMRAANTSTSLGRLWLVLNPLLLSGVYYILLFIVGSGKNVDFAQITSGLFFFTFLSTTILSGTGSVTSGGNLILNMSFPKALLPFSSTYLAFRRFLPTMLVYAVIHVLVHRPITFELLWVIPSLVIGTLFAVGLGMLFATMQVYFRDTVNFLPYFIRIWLYLSPVLWTAESFAQSHEKYLRLAEANPLFPIFGVWDDALTGHAPSLVQLLVGTLWGVGAFVLGGLFFMSREREFAVRL